MADKDEFSFDQEAAHTPPPAPAAPTEKLAPSGSSRALLLGLLLVVLGAAAYFYSMEMRAPDQDAVPVGVTKQLIPPPPPPAPTGDSPSSPRQEPAQAGQPAQGSPGAGAGVSVVQQPPAQAEKGLGKDGPSEPPPAAAEPAQPAAQAAVEGAAGPVATPVEPPSAASSDKGSAKAAVVAAQPARGAYTLLAGAYILPQTLQAASNKVTKLGYQPRTLRDAKLVEMTRVRIGAFAPEEARSQLAAVKQFAPDAFTLPEGDQVVVYAASHFDPAAHNAFAEGLRKAGIAFEVEKVQRRMPMTELFFGDFPDRQTAEQAAAKARKAGLDIIVFKRP